MIVNNEIRTKYKIEKRNRLYLISSSIRENLGDYNKKEDDKRK